MFPSRTATLEDIAPFFIAMGESFWPSGRQSKKEAILHQYLEPTNENSATAARAAYPYAPSSRMDMKRWNIVYDTKI